jgi:hypothetical protein
VLHKSLVRLILVHGVFADHDVNPFLYLNHEGVSTLIFTNTTRKVIISDDLLVTLLNLVTEWYVFNDEVLSFVISYERRTFGSKNNDENEKNVTES